MQGITRETNSKNRLNRSIDRNNQCFSNAKHKRYRRNKLFTSMFISLTCLMISMCSTIGSTYAWFTDSASNTGNRIKSGTLAIDLLKYEDSEYKSIADKSGSIFSSNTIWEPGSTQIAYLAVKNTGNLALKYRLVLNITDGGLAQYLDVYYENDVVATNPLKESTWDELTNDKKTYNVSDLLSTKTNGQVIAAQNGKLLPIDGSEDGTDYFVLVIHMKENAPSDVMGKNIIFDVSLQATQVSEESDAFSNTYDSSCKFVTLENK